MIQSAHERWVRQGGRELLLDYIRHLETRRNGRRAVHIAVSSLPPSDRLSRHVQAATAGFSSLAKASRGQLFVLGNADVVFVYESEHDALVATEVETLRTLLGVTPARERDPDGRGLETWFDLENSYETFVALVRGATDTEDLWSSSEREPASGNHGSVSVEANNGVAATRETVSRLSEALRNADLSNLLRRQAVYALGPHMYPQPLFREFYYSIPDLGDAVLPSGDLVSNRVLFRHATRSLDKAMLSLLMRSKNDDADLGISINLNLSTVLSDDFLRFDKSLGPAGRKATIIELQCADIASEVKAYSLARAFLRDRGYRVCVDGVTPSVLELADRVCPGVDFVKVHWDPELVDLAEKQRAGILVQSKADDQPRLVITRAGTPDAVAFGQSVGIELFQGRYMDAFARRDRRWRDLVRLNRGFQAGH